MALPKNFPKSPYEILDPRVRWTPDASGNLYETLLPPLVHILRKEIKTWRDNNYVGASETSIALLRWWFDNEHPTETAEQFRYYFAQREAVETVIYLYDVAGAKDKHDLIQYSSTNTLSINSFPEDWLRLVIKMATGSGKTKVISLLMAWSYFHKMYEDDSKLARNFLLIAPNIIVLDRLRTDFGGAQIFSKDPVLPNNGYEGQNWRADFQMRVRLQDEVSAISKPGNLFLTNIHRIYSSKDRIPSADDEDTTDYFLGDKPVTKTGDSKINLADIMRDIDELVVFNDEAHHIHDDKLAWYKSIEDINNHMKGKDTSLSLQIDVTATPKHNNGRIFAQTISDYPLVEAIYQNVVKHPVVPNKESVDKLIEKPSAKVEEKYADHIHLGYLEWQKAYAECAKLGKKAVLFVMTDDTRNCDDIAAYLKKYPDLSGEKEVLTIHTKNNGEISEVSSGKKEGELQELRKAAREIDNFDNPYKAIVSVLMLKEGWDVKNVTTIVGLRPYSAKSNILPEQTLGRGLRRMFGPSSTDEKVVVIGTKAFMEFIAGIQKEGVILEEVEMGEHTKPQMGLAIEVDRDNPNKNIAELDMKIPILPPRIYRDYDRLSALDFSNSAHQKLIVKQFSDAEQRNIVFHYVVGNDKSHETKIGGADLSSHREILGYYAQIIMKQLRMFSSYDLLFGKLKEFVTEYLFTQKVNLEERNILKNLVDEVAKKTIIDTFIKAINALLVVEKDAAKIQGYICLSEMRPFLANQSKYIVPQKSVVNKIIGDSGFELEFARFLESCHDIISYGKNYYAVNFRVDYITASGDIKNYHPDFFVKVSEREVYIVETKGREDINDGGKIKRLRQWCEDVNAAQNIRFSVLYVLQEKYETYRPTNFSRAVEIFQHENPTGTD